MLNVSLQEPCCRIHLSTVTGGLLGSVKAPYLDYQNLRKDIFTFISSTFDHVKHAIIAGRTLSTSAGMMTLNDHDGLLYPQKAAAHAHMKNVSGGMKTAVPLPSDSVLYDGLRGKTEVKELVLHLYWRVQLQLMVLEVFITFARRNLIFIVILALPVDFYAPLQGSILPAHEALETTFSKFKRMYSPPQSSSPLSSTLRCACQPR